MPIEQVFTAANEKLCQNNDAGMFVTAWMGLLNVKTGQVTFANAGHNPPLTGSGGSFDFLKIRANFVLAGMDGIRYRKNELQLKPGDTIFLYTDGVTEATDPEQKLYGDTRLQNLLNSRSFASPGDICQAVKAQMWMPSPEQPSSLTTLPCCA